MCFLSFKFFLFVYFCYGKHHYTIAKMGICFLYIKTSIHHSISIYSSAQISLSLPPLRIRCVILVSSDDLQLLYIITGEFLLDIFPLISISINQCLSRLPICLTINTHTVIKYIFPVKNYGALNHTSFSLADILKNAYPPCII